MLDNKAKLILKNVSKELEELRNLAIDEVSNKLLNVRKATDYKKLNQEKYDLIAYAYGKDEADQIIMEEIYELLDDFYSEMPLKTDMYRDAKWIGKFVLPKLPNIRFSNKKRRELIKQFGYENSSTYEPYRDESEFGQILDDILKTNYLGIYYQGSGYFSHYFMDDNGLYEIVVEDMLSGLCINCIFIRRDDDYHFWEED